MGIIFKNDILFRFKIRNLANLKIQEMHPIKIYYCLYGRNSWHSTWTQKYYKDCMHSDLESAKSFAELKRVQGSVFYIKELPALLFISGDTSIIVTQINELCPLRQYSAYALKENLDKETKKIESFKDNYLTFNSPMNGVVLSFKFNSRFWKTSPPESNSIMVLYTTNKFEPIQLKTTKLKAWKSFSVGSDYKLLWTPVDNKVSQSSVLRLFKQSEFYNKKHINS